MNSVLTTDQKIAQILTARVPTTIDEVISQMETLDSSVPGDDGLKWFNSLYLLVTKEVKDHPPSSGWKNPAWLTRLDVVFAGLYFTALLDSLSQPASTPKAWQALFEARHRGGVDRIQFALAGMNAHINRDLSIALLQADAEFGLTPNVTSPEHDDFEHVNDLLEAVIPQTLELFATGILGEVAQDTGKIGRLLAIWNVRAARDLAWDFSDHLRNLTGVARTVALTVQDKITGALGRGLLLPI